MQEVPWQLRELVDEMNPKEINIPLYKDAGFSSAQMRALAELLEKNPSIHWLTLNPNTGIFEIVLDNQMLKTFRACPSHFMEAYVEGWGGTGRSWNLDFGILFHKMMESYYANFREKGFLVNDWAIQDGVFAWNAAQMDFYIGQKEYQSMGGVHGFVGLLVAYAQRFSNENERIRVIGTEIGFGKNKEVKLGSLESHPQAFLDCYLSGRIDVLIDDGHSICPLDHKTKGTLKRDPNQEFEIDEGPTGYIYAVNQILPVFLSSPNPSCPLCLGKGSVKLEGMQTDWGKSQSRVCNCIKSKEGLLKRDCKKIVMNYISKSIPKKGDRFKRLAILKTDEQLESYRLRMLATSEDIFRAVVRYASTGVAFRNTERCTNLYMRDCDFLPVHRQNSKANELVMLNQFFKKGPIWNTEEVGKE
jgi:hypothetical protein